MCALGRGRDNPHLIGVGAVRILVVEDEQKVAQALRTGLEAQGYEVIVAQSGEDGFFLLNTASFDLAVLDLMLPGRDGLDILRAIRKRGLATPVLILTARDAVEDRVLGLDSGADDYLVKPFAFTELLARIRVLLRRGWPEPPRKLALADLEVAVLARHVTRAGRVLPLTSREFDLLVCLLQNQDDPGRHVHGRS